MLERLVAEPGDGLDDEERAELRATLEAGLAVLRTGGGIDAEELLSELRARG